MIFFTEGKSPPNIDRSLECLKRRIPWRVELKMQGVINEAMQELAEAANLIADEKHHESFRAHAIDGSFVQNRTTEYVEIDLVLTANSRSVV